MHGKDLLIAANGRVIAAQRTCSLNMQQDTIEVCSPVSGPWREYIPGTLGWNVSCDGLIYEPEYADELMDVLTRRQKVRLSYYDPELRIVRSGYAIPTVLQEGASISDLASYSLTFQGSGELEKVAYEFAQYTANEVVDDRYLEPTKDHHIVQFQTGVRVREITITTPTRLRMQCILNQPVLVLIKATIAEAKTIFENGQTIEMYRRELSHISNEVSDIPQSDDVVLAPGKYCVCGNDDTAGNAFVSMLSLPT